MTTQPEEALKQIADLREKIGKQADDPSNVEASRRLDLLENHAKSLVKVNPFNKERIAEGRSVLYQAAANLVAESSPGHRLLSERAVHVGKSFTPAPDGKGSSLLHPSEDVAKKGRKSKTVKIARGVKLSLANLLVLNVINGRLRKQVNQPSVDTVVRDRRVDERALAQASAAAVLKDSKGKPIPSKSLKDRFRMALNVVLQKRDNPTIERVLPIPVRRLDGKDALISVTCRQVPARVLTASLTAKYDQDGIQGVNCHDNMQYRHALNLYRSSLEHQDGRPLLSMVRHGVHSAVALTPEGIQALPDPELGQMALDLREYGLQDPVLTQIRRTAIARVPDSKDSQDHKAGPDPKNPVPAPTSSITYTESELREAAARVRRGGSGLLDPLRKAANQARALESAQAAITCLPKTELQRILDSRPGEIPVVRLASVSLLTPDAVRGLFKGPAKDERLMWHDQQAAWQALAERPYVELDVPQDGGGFVKRMVKLEIAAFNIPVNEEGAHAIRGNWRLVVGNSHTANQEAMAKLLGPLPASGETAEAALSTWKPGGWVGSALSAYSPLGKPQKDLLLALAKQVAEISIEDRSASARQADPYRLVKRILVMVHQTGLAAPMVNCRSGKDRTSEAETQARQFALEVSESGVAHLPGIHSPAGTDDHVQQLQLWNLLQGGGSREIQHWNTGHAGTKLSQAALLAQYGIGDDKELRRQYQGMSAHVQA